MFDIIIGSTNEMDVTLFRVKTDNNLPFVVDEYFRIEDKKNNNPICRVVETTEVPFKEVAQDLENLENMLPITIEEIGNWVYIAKAQIQSEILMPISAGAKISPPTFDEIKHIIYTCDINKGLALGEIRGTETLYKTIPTEFNNICPMMKDDKIMKQNGAPYIFDYRKMDDYPNVGFFGGSGSGKTYAMKSFLEQIIKAQYPTIVFDPHYEMSFESRDDYEDSYDYASRVDHFIVGETVGIDFSQLTTDALINIMRCVGEISPAMEAGIMALHTKGDSLLRIKALIKELMQAFQDMENKDGKATIAPASKSLYNQYRGQIAGFTTLSAISWRLNTLDARGVFAADINEVLKSLSKKRMCVLRGPIDNLNIVGSYLVNECHDKRRAYVDDKTNGCKKHEPMFLPFMIVMDEAHAFAPANGTSPMNYILERIAKEGRKYGMFEVLATQRPKLMNKTVIAQLSTKFIFRTMTEEDIATIKQESNLALQNLRRLPNLSPGACFVSSAIAGKCMSIKFKANATKPKNSMTVFDELESISFEDKKPEIIESFCPFSTRNFPEIISKIQKETDESLSIDDLRKVLAKMVAEGKITVKKLSIGETYNKK